MIKFKTLSFRNFLSYGNVDTVVDLERGGTCAIVGKNLDNTEDGITSNGSGKSVIINALIYAIFDKPLSKISKDGLVNNINQSDMNVELIFEKRGMFYKIIRARKVKKSPYGTNYVRVFVRKGDDNFTDGDEKTLDSIDNNNKFIASVIGFPYELFIRTVVFSANHQAFFDLPSRAASGDNQSSIIEELFNLTVLSDRADALKDMMRTDKTAAEKEEYRIQILKSEHEKVKAQIDAVDRRISEWEEEKKQKLEKYNGRLLEVSTINVQEQLELLEQYNEMNQSKKETQTLLRTMRDAKRTHTDRISKLQKEIDDLKESTCPYCKQHFAEALEKIPSKLVSVIDDTKALRKVDKKINTLIEAATNIEECICEIDDKIEIKSERELRAIDKEISELEIKIQNLMDTTNPHILSKQDMSSYELDELDYDELNRINALIEHEQFLQKLLTKKDSFIRKALLNNNIPFLNERLRFYLMQMGMVHNVEFTQDLGARISKYDRELEFDNLSNGQRARINIALSFAFRDVLEALHNKINICVLDEVFDIGLDTSGVARAVELIKTKAESDRIGFYVISHRDEIDNNFDRCLSVIMEDEFSRIEDA